MKEIIFKIEGMHCNGCAMAVKFELEELDFIKEAEVDIGKKQALIKYESIIDMEKIEKVITNLGFKLIK